MPMKNSQVRHSFFSGTSTPNFTSIDLDIAKKDLMDIRQTDDFTDRLCRVLKIPTYSHYEEYVRQYSVSELEASGCTVTTDKIGNVYAIKGTLEEGQKYPLFMAHMDSVHRMANIDLWIHDGWIGGVLKDGDAQYGIGGDDKCGVFVCLEMARMRPIVKIALFMGEEPGCIGSSQADKTFFTDVGYGIEIDSPEVGIVSRSCSGVKLFKEDGEFWTLIAPIVEKYMGSDDGLDLQDHPYTDVKCIRSYGNFPCPNLPAGYFNWHSSGELTRIEIMKGIVDGCKEIVETAGLRLFDEGQYFQKNYYREFQE